MSAAPETAERILDAAAELFASHGYAATTTRAIAEQAGVNEVTVFRRFENKRGVLKALGQRFESGQAGHAAWSLEDEGGVRETLLRLARMEIETTARTGALAIRLAFDARSVPEVAELLGDAVPANLEGLAGYMAEHQGSGELRDDIDPRVMAEAFFALTSSYVMYRVTMGVMPMPCDIDTDAGIEQLFDLFWSGAATKEETR